MKLKTLIHFALLLSMTIVGIARADCSVEPSRYHLTYAEQTLAARNAFFLSVCGDGEKQVVDLTDPTLKGRIGTPLHGRSSHKGDYYPDIAKRRGHQGKTIMAYVVEPTGEVKDVAVISSSGYDDLDQAATDIVRHVRWETPGSLDGTPVRVILYFPIDWKLNSVKKN